MFHYVGPIKSKHEVLISKWLNEEESNQAILLYSYFAEMSPSQIKEFFVYENKFMNFFKVLYEQNEIFAGCCETEAEEYYYFGGY